MVMIAAARSSAPRMASAASSAMTRSALRRTYATPGNTGPSKVESQPQGSDQRGKTTTYILPAVAAALAIGAFTWRFASGDKAGAVGVGVNQDGPDKLKSGAARRVEEKEGK